MGKLRGARREGARKGKKKAIAVFLAMLVSGFGFFPHVDAARYGAADIAENCGYLAPLHAPRECGVQQWLGYSETNPVAVAWMAVANIGTEACQVTVTRLDLHYRSILGQETLLSSGVNGAQRLSDGTDGQKWGTYMESLETATTFAIPAGGHYYVHPFGSREIIPDDAVELTVSFAADMTDDCVAGGGIDTYAESKDPTVEPPYTQDGSTTDFIKEAIKTPWFGETVDPERPISFSIQHTPSKSADL